MMAERVELVDYVRAGQLLGLAATVTLGFVRAQGIQVRTQTFWALWRAELDRDDGEATA